VNEAQQPGRSTSAPRLLAVFDLDGTLADLRHREHHLARTPKDWDAFFRAARADPPLATGVALLRESAKECEIAYLSGRPERCRADTRAWLQEHDLPAGELVLRRDQDRRPARVVKPAALRRLAGDRTVAVVVDDDDAVCDAYERAGWPVLRVGWASGSSALELAQEVEGRT